MLEPTWPRTNTTNPQLRPHAHAHSLTLTRTRTNSLHEQQTHNTEQTKQELHTTTVRTSACVELTMRTFRAPSKNDQSRPQSVHQGTRLLRNILPTRVPLPRFFFPRARTDSPCADTDQVPHLSLMSWNGTGGGTPLSPSRGDN